jgi:hypothetical protein
VLTAVVSCVLWFASCGLEAGFGCVQASGACSVVECRAWAVQRCEDGGVLSLTASLLARLMERVVSCCNLLLLLCAACQMPGVVQGSDTFHSVGCCPRLKDITMCW